MKTYEYTVHPDTPRETKLFFSAGNREQADELVKEFTKRNSKTVFVEVHNKAMLQSLPERIKSSSSEYLLIYTCPECGYEWAKTGETFKGYGKLRKRTGTSSHMFQMPCQNEYVEHTTDASKCVTYNRVYHRFVDPTVFDTDGVPFMEGGNWERPAHIASEGSAK